MVIVVDVVVVVAVSYIILLIATDAHVYEGRTYVLAAGVSVVDLLLVSFMPKVIAGMGNLTIVCKRDRLLKDLLSKGIQTSKDMIPRGHTLTRDQIVALQNDLSQKSRQVSVTWSANMPR